VTPLSGNRFATIALVASCMSAVMGAISYADTEKAEIRKRKLHTTMTTTIRYLLGNMIATKYSCYKWKSGSTREQPGRNHC
jgi:hypothetical protein